MSYQYPDEHRESVAGTSAQPIWVRGLIMLLFIFCVGFAQPVLFTLALIQFLWMAFKGERNAFIGDFGRSLAAWLAEITRFLTAATEEKPFPWKAWPAG
jgi:Domain of unknown function (DUF4389)